MMKKLRFISILGALALALAMITTGCTDSTTTTATKPAATKPIAGDVLDPAAWGKVYPEQYQSYLKNNEQAKTEFGGSVPESKFITEPEVVKLFAGFGFSKEYNEDRGHTYAMEDLLASARVTPKSPGSCLTCKTPYAGKLMKEMGPAYSKTPLLDLLKQKEVKHGVTCAMCHNPQTNELEITRPDAVESLKKRGIDVTKATRQEMRTLVCAQCHVEYYFDPETKAAVFPWDNGIEPEQVYDYYNKIGFADWEHPDSKAKMLKGQHPEYETFSTGVHGTAGVSCADCHMPYMKADGKKISSHQWTSPLKSIEISCQKCHSQDVNWLKERVKNTQTRTFKLQATAGHNLVEAHEAIKQALLAPNADQGKIKEAQELVRKGQFAWDWVAAENSRGFHNPVQSMDSLAKASEYAHKAKALAEAAH